MWLKLHINKPKDGTMTEVVVLDKSLLVANIDGELFCASNKCPHEDIALTLGCFKGKRIKCSLHGFSFDLKTGSSDEAGVDNLSVFAIKEEAGQLFVSIPQ